MEQVTNKKPVAEEAKKTVEQKAAKAEAAKRFKERRAEEAKARVENAKALIKYMQDKKIWDSLEQKFKDFLNGLANPVARTSSGTNSLFNKIFGDSPKVGDKKTLMQIFEATFKSKADVDRQVKEWAKKGIVVEYTSAANTLESTYTIKALAK